MDARTLARLKALPRRDPLVVVAALWLALVVVVTLAAPWLSAQDPTAVDYAQALRAPSAAHPLGTDNFGRDVLVRVMNGGRASLTTAAIAVAIIIGVSVVVGATAGYLGGWLDVAVSRVIDVLLAFPQLVLAIAIAALLGAGLGSLIFAVTAVSWPGYARIFRSYVLQVKHEGYVVAARCAGTPTWKILFGHVLGAIVGPVLVLATLDLGQIILGVASLSFLGLGIRPPTPEWGSMLNESRPFVERAPWSFLAPGAAIFLVVMCANYAGDAVRDALDPRQPRVPQVPSLLSLLRLDVRRAAAARRRTRAERLEQRAVVCRALVDTAGTAARPIVVDVRDLHVQADGGATRREVADAGSIAGVAGVGSLAGSQSASHPALVMPVGNAGAVAGIAGVRDRLPILRGVSLTIRAGECVGVVGESGSGKSTLAAAIMGLLRPPLGVAGGSIQLLGEDATAWSWDDWRPVRGRHVALVSQDPLNALNPLLKIGDQIGECLRYHAEPRLSPQASRARVQSMLDRVRLPHSVLGEYPHQLSGGMRQRVVIAMALINEPQLLIADEPTTALDVTTQARILEELAALQRTLGVAMIFISHDLRLVGKIAERVVVMREGQIVEENTARALFQAPQHAYTRQLIASMPGAGHGAPRPATLRELVPRVEREGVAHAGD